MIETKIGKYTIDLYEHDKVWMPTSFGIGLGEEIVKMYNPREIEGKVLDLGVGSGLLSILCGMLGTEKVVALDINPHALENTKVNWKRNLPDNNNIELRRSDLFSAMEESEKNSFQILVSNPPTFPEEPKDRYERNDRDEWELAGKEGREILDVLIKEGQDWLKRGGKLLTIATSPQSWPKTKKLLNCYWKEWQVLKTKDLPLAEYYGPYLDFWKEKSREESELRIFKKGGKWFQRLYFIEATKL